LDEGRKSAESGVPAPFTLWPLSHCDVIGLGEKLRPGAKKVEQAAIQNPKSEIQNRAGLASAGGSF
jgi:hypothetical protein